MTKPKNKKDKLIIILSIVYWSIPLIVGVLSIIAWNFIGLAIILFGYLVSWLIGVHHKLHIRIWDLEFDNKQNIKRIIDLEDDMIYWRQEQKESQRKSFVYEPIELSNPEITKDLVNEIAESNKNAILNEPM